MKSNYQEASLLCLEFLEQVILQNDCLSIINDLTADEKNEMINASKSSILNFTTIINSENVVKNYNIVIDETKLDECFKIYNTNNKPGFLTSLRNSLAHGNYTVSNDFRTIKVNFIKGSLIIPLEFFNVYVKDTIKNNDYIEDNEYYNKIFPVTKLKKINNNNELLDYIINTPVLYLKVLKNQNIDFKQIDNYITNYDIFGLKDSNLKFKLELRKKITDETIIRNIYGDINSISNFYYKTKEEQSYIVSGIIKNNYTNINLENGLKVLLEIVNNYKDGKLNSKLINENIYQLMYLIDLMKFYILYAYNFDELKNNINFNNIDTNGLPSNNYNFIRHIRNCISHKDRIILTRDKEGYIYYNFKDMDGNTVTFDKNVDVYDFHTFINNEDNIKKLKKYKTRCK